MTRVLWTGLEFLRALLETFGIAIYFGLALILFPIGILGPLSNLFFRIVWAAYDISTVKRSNMNAVVYTLDVPGPIDTRNPEMEWGFG